MSRSVDSLPHLQNRGHIPNSGQRKCSEPNGEAYPKAGAEQQGVSKALNGVFYRSSGAVWENYSNEVQGAKTPLIFDFKGR